MHFIWLWIVIYKHIYILILQNSMQSNTQTSKHSLMWNAAMPTCLRHVEDTLGSCLRAWSLSPRNASDGYISYRLGSGHEWPPCPRSVEWSPSHMAHQLPGDAGHVSSTQTLSTRPERSPCVDASRHQSINQSINCIWDKPLEMHHLVFKGVLWHPIEEGA